MRFIKENSGTNTFLTYEVPVAQELDMKCLGTLTNNRIPGYLPVSYTQMDDVQYIRYNITSKISVEELFQGVVSKKKLLSILRGVVNALMTSDEYIFLEQSSIVLDREYIFMDVATNETFVVCLPLEKEAAGEVNARSFLKGLLTDPTTEEEDDQYVGTLLRYMNKSPKLSLPEFREFLDQLIASKPVISSKTTRQVTAEITDNRGGNMDSGNRTMQVNNTNGRSHTNGSDASGASADTGHGKKSIKNNLEQHFGKNGYGRDEAKKPGADAAKEKKGLFGGIFGGKNEDKDSKNQKKPENPKIPQKRDDAAPGAMNTVNGRKVNIPRVAGSGSAPIPKMENSSRKESNTTGNQPSVSGQRGAQENNQRRQEQQANQPPQNSQADNGGGFPGTVVLNSPPDSIGTTLLEVQHPYLVYLRTRKQIPVDKPVFKIGKESSQVDYTIVGNSAVSRSHAKIITRVDKYFLEDTQSKNGTFLNGTRLTSGKAVQINHGDKLVFANEEFEFIIK